MTQPWDPEYRSPRKRKRRSLRYRAKRKVKTGLYAIGLVALCYMAVAQHTVRAANSVK